MGGGLQIINSLGLTASQTVMLFMAGVFALVFSLTYAVGRTIRTREAIRQRALHGGYTSDDADDRRSLGHQRLAGTRKLLGMVASNVMPGDKQSLSAIRKTLMQSGYFNASAVSWYYLSRVALAVALPAAGFVAFQLGLFDLSPARTLGLLAGLGVLGLQAPSFYVSHRRRKMQRQSREGFPEFMDLMVVCAEAGVSMEQAIERVSRDLAQSYPFLGVNLHMASLELRAGRTLIDAFDNLARRLGIEEAQNLGSLLQQSEELGTSLSNALRVFSDEMRDKRMSRAEEKAHALPAKMAVPLTMFVFPSILVVIMLPVFVRISNNF